jgi:hypothetical protein
MTRTLTLCALVSVLLATAAHAAPPHKTVLYREMGGVIDDHRARWKALAESGNEVEIRGRCQSACTLIVGYIPRDRICFDEHAEFAVHMPYDQVHSCTKLYRGLVHVQPIPARNPRLD